MLRVLWQAHLGQMHLGDHFRLGMKLRLHMGSLMILFFDLTILVRRVVHVGGLGTRDSGLILLTHVLSSLDLVQSIFSLVNTLHFVDLFCACLLIHISITTSRSESHD